jgi:hypothetical protein
MSERPVEEQSLGVLVAKVVLSMVGAVVCGWLCYLALRYALTTPQCEQMGTCSVAPTATIDGAG